MLFAGVAWIVCALLGTHYVSTVFVASDSAVTLARETVLKVPEGIRDKRRSPPRPRWTSSATPRRPSC